MEIVWLSRVGSLEEDGSGEEREHGGLTAGDKENGIGELDDWEATEVLEINDVTQDAQRAKWNGKSVDNDEEDLRHDDGVYHACEEFLCYHRVLFHELGEVVEPGC